MKSSIFLTAAALAATGFSFAPAMAANATNAASTPPSNASVNGSETSSAASSSLMTDVKIQSVIAGVTQDALTPGDMKHLISFFPPTQQENIRKSSSFSQGYGDKELIEKLGHNDPCPCGSNKCFQKLLPEVGTILMA